MILLPLNYIRIMAYITLVSTQNKSHTLDYLYVSESSNPLSLLTATCCLLSLNPSTKTGFTCSDPLNYDI